MSTARALLSTSAVNGKIYAIGGTLINPGWYRGISTVEEYNPATNTWTRKADMPTGRTYFSTSVVNGKIYAIGGLTSGIANHVSPVEEYDPATDTWTRKADIPTARSGLTTSAVNGRIYAIGGWVGSSKVLSTVEEYDATPPLVVDFNGDGIVDSADICMMIDHWHTDEPLYDIGPRPFGDGIVDVQDLIVLSEHLFTYPGAVAHWKLDETGGIVASDSTGNNDGYVFGGAIWKPDEGHVGGAVQFDGIDDFIPAPAPLKPADGPFSVLVWVKGGAPGQAIISEPGGPDWLSLDSLTGGLMTELAGGGRGGGGGPLSSQTAIDDGSWHRVGLVWDGSLRTLYVDGVAVAEDTQNSLEALSDGLYIACGKNMQAGTFFSGLIDDVLIYNRAVKP
jgi:hypothetical protein